MNNPSSAPTRDDPLLGTPYECIRLLGAGGMGQVLVARERSTDRKVAVKLIRKRFGHMPDLVERFYAEAKAASQTGHAHIVEVLDFGTTQENRPYMVMELLPGKNLHEFIYYERRLEQTLAIDICRQLCDGLGAAHVRGVVHRDLKPANVFLVDGMDHDPFVKILDFGLAQLTHPNKIPEVPIRIYGTPEYMAPEMARPERPTEAPADVYSLGVLLYQMLTGDIPFSHDDPKKIVQCHLNTVPQPPRERAPDAGIHPALQRVVLKALRKRPERRYLSMEEMSRSLWKVERQIAKDGQVP